MGEIRPKSANLQSTDNLITEDLKKSNHLG